MAFGSGVVVKHCLIWFLWESFSSLFLSLLSCPYIKFFGSACSSCSWRSSIVYISCRIPYMVLHSNAEWAGFNIFYLGKGFCGLCSEIKNLYLGGHLRDSAYAHAASVWNSHWRRNLDWRIRVRGSFRHCRRMENTNFINVECNTQEIDLWILRSFRHRWRTSSAGMWHAGFWNIRGGLDVPFCICTPETRPVSR